MKKRARNINCNFPPSSRVWTSAFAMQSASFALATTHSQDVLLYASRPHRRSPLKGNPRRPLRVGTHERD